MFIQCINIINDNVPDVHVRNVPGAFDIRILPICLLQKVTFADYGVYDVMMMLKTFAPGCLDKFTLLNGFVNRMSERPNLKKYINSDKHKSIPITPNDRLK